MFNEIKKMASDSQTAILIFYVYIFNPNTSFSYFCRETFCLHSVSLDAFIVFKNIPLNIRIFIYAVIYIRGEYIFRAICKYSF